MKAVVQDLVVEYTEEGEGPMMLMLHGWGNTMHYFQELNRELPGFRKVMLNLPGFGGSERPRTPWTVEMYARFVKDFCSKLDIQPDILVGHSFGGRIITKGIARNILSAEKLVLVGSAGVARRKTVRNLLYAAFAKIGRVVLYPFPSSVYDKMRALIYAKSGSDYLTMRDMSDTFLLMIREDLSADASQIHTPTLLVWGEGDVVTPVSEGKRLNRLIQDSKLVVIPGAGHFVHREKPVEVAAALRAFL